MPDSARVIGAEPASLPDREAQYGETHSRAIHGGFGVARDVILRQFAGAFSGLNVIPTLENPKGELQELLQANSIEAPQYSVVSASGPDHDRLFECTVHHAGVELARGRGKSKKAAESEAALAALVMLRNKKASEQSPQ